MQYKDCTEISSNFAYEAAEESDESYTSLAWVAAVGRDALRKSECVFKANRDSAVDSVTKIHLTPKYSGPQSSQF